MALSWLGTQLQFKCVIVVVLVSLFAGLIVFVVVVVLRFAPVVPVLLPLGLEAASWSWPSLPHSSKLEY